MVKRNYQPKLYYPPPNLQMNPLGPCLTILTQNVPGVCDSSELQSTGTLRSGSKGQYTPQLSSYLELIYSYYGLLVLEQVYIND